MSSASYLLPSCRGGPRLIEQLDRAVQPVDTAIVVAGVQRVLQSAIADPGIELPAVIARPLQRHYARRELYRSTRHGYSVIAMTWAPHQGTPLHDHDGLWCVDGVWQGELQVTQYELLEDQADRARFRVAGTLPAGRGSAGSLIPPHEYHVLQNPSDDTVAVSVHVYQGPMEHCTVFLPEGRDGWFRREEKLLLVDDTC